DDGAGARGRRPHVRRPVRGDQGAARRLLPRGLQGPRRGHRSGVEDPGRDARLDRGAPDLGDVTSPDVELAVARAFREEWGRIGATLIRTQGDWALAAQ